MLTARCRRVDRIAGFAVAALWLAGVIAPAWSAVFGPDERATLPPTLQGLKSKIGALRSSRTGSVCSAFCLSADVIATASHCVFGANGARPPDLSSLEFQLDGAAAAGIGGRSIGLEAQHIIAGAQRLHLTPPIDAARDWAVVKLERPACRHGGLVLSSRSPSGETGVYHIAIHRDVATPNLRFAADCRLKAASDAVSGTAARDFTDSRAVLLHACDTGSGSSGSPMLVDRNGEGEVVALNVGVYVSSRTVPSATGGAPPPRRPIANTAISVAPLAHALEALKNRDLLSTLDEIVRVQRRLTALSLYRGQPTGRVDDALTAAVVAYERRANRKGTGLLTKELLIELER